MIRPFKYHAIRRDDAGIAHYEGRPASLVEMLRATVEKTPHAEAIVEIDGERVSYRDLWDRSARVAGGLRSLGLRMGDRVAIRLPNGLNWCLAFFGAQMAGAIAVPVNTRFSEQEVAYVISDSGSMFTFMADDALPDGPAFVSDQVAADDISAIFYTSGTTGFPKGAITTHEGFLANTETCHRIMTLPADGSVRNLVSVPLFHVTGCNSQLLPTCETGGTTVIMPTFDVQAFLAAITQERVNLLFSVPAIYWLALNQPNFGGIDTQGVRWVVYGGAPIAPALVARILEAFPAARISNSYGLTETTSLSTFLPHEFARARPDSVGFAAPVVDLRLFEEDPRSGVGELLVRGPNVVRGYWNKSEATAQTFVEGWLHTGDLARLDTDGFVQIVDRKKDMINRGGENVYCVEVESALVAHPAVLEAAVVGVPDEMMGEKVGAVLVVKPGSKVDVNDILAFAGTRLADFKVPQYVALRQEPLARNPGGKVLKARLRQGVDWGVPLR